MGMKRILGTFKGNWEREREESRSRSREEEEEEDEIT